MAPFPCRAPRYSRNVGRKFYKDGIPQEYPGNTVICHVPQECSTFSFLVQFRNLLMVQSWAKKYSFLPVSSYHMTVFEGLCDQVRTPAHWTSKLPLDAPLEDADRLLIEQWENLDPPESFSVRHRFFFALDTMGLRLSSVSSEEEREMRDFRDTLSEAFGIRHPNHHRYRFHITLAYNIERLLLLEIFRILCFSLKHHNYIKQQFGLLRLGSPELTFFADVTNFAHNRKDAIRNCQS